LGEYWRFDAECEFWFWLWCRYELGPAVTGDSGQVRGDPRDCRGGGLRGGTDTGAGCGIGFSGLSKSMGSGEESSRSDHSEDGLRMTGRQGSRGARRGSALDSRKRK
jgi:hypothetical protein